MKKFLILSITLVLLSSFISKDHETYLSVTEIEYKEGKNNLQIISRVFIDDFERVLSKRYQREVSLSYDKDLQANKELMARYIGQKLHIVIDGKQVPLKFLGSKFDTDQIVLFIEAKNLESFNNVRVENLILTDLFDDQKNIVHVKKGDRIESMLLVKSKSSGEAHF